MSSGKGQNGSGGWLSGIAAILVALLGTGGIAGLISIFREGQKTSSPISSISPAAAPEPSASPTSTQSSSSTTQSPQEISTNAPLVSPAPTQSLPLPPPLQETPTNSYSKVFSIDAQQLLTEYANNGTMADLKYTKEIVKVTGAFAGIVPCDEGASNCVKLGDVLHGYVYFYFPKSDSQVRELVQSINEGDFITLQGRVTESKYVTDPQMLIQMLSVLVRESTVTALPQKPFQP